MKKIAIIVLVLFTTYLTAHNNEIQFKILNSGLPWRTLVTTYEVNPDGSIWGVNSSYSYNYWKFHNWVDNVFDRNFVIDLAGGGQTPGSHIVQTRHIYVIINNRYAELIMPQSSPDGGFTFVNNSFSKDYGNSWTENTGAWPILDASINGTSLVVLPTKTENPRIITWTSNVSGGTTPYSYKWYYNTGGSGYTLVGTGSSYTKTYYYSGNITRTDNLKLVVTDNESETKTIFKTISILPPLSQKIDEIENQLVMDVVPEYLTINNYPNPFNPTTNINYNLPENSIVNIDVYDLNGQNVISWDLGDQSIGSHSIMWNGTNQNGEEVPAGVYLYHFKAIATNSDKVYSEKRKMIFMK